MVITKASCGQGHSAAALLMSNTVTWIHIAAAELTHALVWTPKLALCILDKTVQFPNGSDVHSWSSQTAVFWTVRPVFAPNWPEPWSLGSHWPWEVIIWSHCCTDNLNFTINAGNSQKKHSTNLFYKAMGTQNLGSASLSKVSQEGSILHT